MKTVFSLLAILAIFSACNNAATIEKKADSVSKKIDTFAQKVLDSGKKDLKDLKIKIQNQFDKKDSATKKVFSNR